MSVQHIALDTQTPIKNFKTPQYVSKPMTADELRQQKTKEMIKRKAAEALEEDKAAATLDSNAKRAKLAQPQLGKKKRVTWAPDNKLCQIREFEKQPKEIEMAQEEGGFKFTPEQIASYKNMAQRDKMHEKEEMQKRNRMSDVKTIWQTPPALIDSTARVVNTQETQRQVCIFC